MSVLGVTDLWTYLLGTVVIILLPGPNSLFVLAVSARQGLAAGWRAAAAVFIGDALLMLLAALGLASLLKAAPLVFQALSYVGAAYLCWLGFGLLRDGWRRLRAPLPAPSASRALANGPVFSRALVLSLSNPKAIAFYLSFFIQFVDPGYAHPGLSFLLLGAILELMSFFYLALLIGFGVHLAAWFARRKKLSATASSAVGGLFIGFGVKLAASAAS